MQHKSTLQWTTHTHTQHTHAHTQTHTHAHTHTCTHTHTTHTNNTHNTYMHTHTHAHTHIHHTHTHLWGTWSPLLPPVQSHQQQLCPSSGCHTQSRRQHYHRQPYTYQGLQTQCSETCITEQATGHRENVPLTLPPPLPELPLSPS